jgi:hypothetical protein
MAVPPFFVFQRKSKTACDYSHFLAPYPIYHPLSQRKINNDRNLLLGEISNGTVAPHDWGPSDFKIPSILARSSPKTNIGLIFLNSRPGLCGSISIIYPSYYSEWILNLSNTTVKKISKNLSNLAA